MGVATSAGSEVDAKWMEKNQEQIRIQDGKEMPCFSTIFTAKHSGDLQAAQPVYFTMEPNSQVARIQRPH
jgi:hypothetical protein